MPKPSPPLIPHLKAHLRFKPQTCLNQLPTSDSKALGLSLLCQPNVFAPYFFLTTSLYKALSKSVNLPSHFDQKLHPSRKVLCTVLPLARGEVHLAIRPNDNHCQIRYLDYIRPQKIS